MSACDDLSSSLKANENGDDDRLNVRAARPDNASLRLRVLTMINANWMTHALGAAAELGLCDLIADGRDAVDALAEATACDRDRLRRLLRALVTLEVLTERDDGRFALLPAGELLRDSSPGSMRGYALFRNSHSHAWAELARSVRTGTNYRLRTHGADDFSHLDEPASAALFHRAMIELTRYVARELLATIDFGRFGCIVDIGGGYGELVASILVAHPALKGIVYDREHARDGAQSRIREAGLSARCEFRSGTFFDAVPVGGDAYLLKSILHDWDDERAIRILRACRHAMHAGARLFVVERLAPQRMSPSPRDQALAASDLNMLVGLSGRERTEPEYAALLSMAGLRVERVVSTAGAFSALEAVAA